MSNFNFEKWLSEHTYFEDNESVLEFISTENGGVCISSWDGEHGVDGLNLEDACTKYAAQFKK